MPSFVRRQAGAADQYHALHEEFHWQVPGNFNIAEVCCARWSGDEDRVALYCEDEDGYATQTTYAQLQQQANRLSNLFAALGVARGDRIAIILPQRAETTVAHIACQQSASVAMPMSILFGPDALEYRLQDSAAVLAIVDASAMSALDAIRANCPALRHVLAVDCAIANTLNWQNALADCAATFTALTTQAEDPAILIYTSGTTGSPKGALLPQRALIGNLTGFVASQNWFPQPDDVFWSPADWAWTGGLMDALLPTLYFGCPIVGYRGRFSADTAFRLMENTVSPIPFFSPLP